MTNEESDQKEAAQNAKTEALMHRQAKLFRMKWLVIPADVCITPKYIRRYYLALLARVCAIWMLIYLLGSCAAGLTVALLTPGSRGAAAISDPAFFRVISDVMTSILEAVWRFVAIIVLYCLLYSAILTASLIQGAKFWNRRALRLQENPLTPPASIPSVWPPPPRVVD